MSGFIFKHKRRWTQAIHGEGGHGRDMVTSLNSMGRLVELRSIERTWSQVLLLRDSNLESRGKICHGERKRDMVRKITS